VVLDTTKLPRLYCDHDLNAGASITLTPDQTHYLSNVMRKNIGDYVRVFNGRGGEFVGYIETLSKKLITLIDLDKIKDQPAQQHKIHLYCAPIKKDRMAFMIEKSVELGVTDIHPIITDRTQHGKINHDKTERHIIEAAEQCERLDIPKLHKIQKLDAVKLDCDTVFVAMERDDKTPVFEIQTSTPNTAILIGPEGGWSDAERTWLTDNPKIKPVSLGNAILRAETAAMFMLARLVF
jgi:16S rRNA (uracil1498-N3)-methyltransferase